MSILPLSAEDEAELREHHPTDLAYERCVICRLLARIDDLRADLADALAGTYGPVDTGHPQYKADHR